MSVANWRKNRSLVWIGVCLVFSCACEQKKEEVADESVAQVVDSKPKESPPKEVEPAPDAPPPWANRLTKDSGFPCAVEKVLAASCRRCHWDPQENDAPFPLVKWEDTRKDRQGSEIWKLMKKQVAADLMPPLEEIVDPPVTPLTAEQKKTLLDYLEAGAERSGESCE